MELTVRPFEEGDRKRRVEIGRLNDPESPPSLEQVERADRNWDGRFFRLLLVAEVDGRVVGWAEARHSPDQHHPEKYRLHVEVDPAVQRRGVGSALYQAVEAALRERNALSLRATAYGSQPGCAACLAFLTGRGFVEVARAWESRLDVAGFDPGPFAGAVERLAAQGIRIATLDEAPGVLPELYDLYLRCERDAPSLDPRTPISFEQDVAGVDAAYRGRGIAMALKLGVIEKARAAGVRELRTTNSSANRPVLRINEALGFRRRPRT